VCSSVLTRYGASAITNYGLRLNSYKPRTALTDANQKGAIGSDARLGAWPTCGDRMRRRKFTPLMKLAVEANGVIALRTLKLMLGGRSARREAELMVSEKIHAAIEAAASLMTGASGDQIIHRYRQHVARNAKRLGRGSKPRKRRRARSGVRL
jgi:hypothetical protein